MSHFALFSLYATGRGQHSYEAHYENHPFRRGRRPRPDPALLFAALAVQAFANGHIDAKNCSNSGMKLCVYDWDDAVRSVPRQSAWIGSGSTDGAACRKSLEQLRCARMPGRPG